MIKIFIPVYNEEEFIEQNLLYMYKKFSQLLEKEFIIYIVNDGSTDQTGNIIDSFSLKNIRHLKCKGPSVRENLAKMFVEHGKKDDLIFFMDADLSTNMSALPQMFAEIRNGYDIVIGSRYQKGSKLERTPFRFFVSKIFNLIIRLYFGSKIKDHECGFKLFKVHIVKDLIKDMGWNLDRRAFWDSEMLIRAQKKKYKIKEVPVTWVEGPKSYISVKKEKSMIPYILKLKFRLISKRG